ncbi:MAG TPA: multicopper oxidase domain-containing protein [Gemmatimonadaceae bacterium]|nr:multicopper oxidase domain-containing protein [Gemmatimonadaceae bacterium]
MSHGPAVALSLLYLLLANSSAAQGASPRGRTRTYFIAADEVTWDYVPGGRDEITGAPYTDSAFFAKAQSRAVKTAYQKVLYVEYIDSTFRTRKVRPPEWAHLGFLGPLIRAVVGDTIRVVFRNNAHRAYSVHPHGVFYEKSSEGVPYDDGTTGRDKRDDAVPPGGTYTYVWPVPARAGPAPMDGSSVMWMYHSHVDEVRDINTGLMGPILITARGMARADGSPRDVDREIVADFAQVHEEDSWLAQENLPSDSLRTLGPIPNPSLRQEGYPWFVKFSINGFVHGAMPLADLTMRKGAKVRWYLMSSTNDFDFHAPHWHGNTVILNGMRTDVAQLSMMQMAVADMVPDNVGTWLFHCHVSFHNEEGMAIRYRVIQ